MRPLIALTGYRGCGKNFIYENIFENWEIQEDGMLPKTIKFKSFAFADLLKIYCSNIYGFSIEEIEKYKREDKIFTVGKLKLTMRQILVNTANRMRDIAGTSFWARLTVDYIDQWVNKNEKDGETIIPIVTDLRFLQELEFLKVKFNTSIIYIENKCEECQKNLKNKDELEIEDIKKYMNKLEIILDCNSNLSKKDIKEIKLRIKKL